MKVAIVHDWFVTYAGAERVVAEILNCFPQADLFSTIDFLQPEDRACLGDRTIKTTWVQRLPAARSLYRAYLPLMAIAIEQLDLRGYDLVISSSHAVAKGVITGPDQLHVSYVNSPMRYAWDLQAEYIPPHRSGLKPLIMRWLLHRLRLWDYLSGQRPDVVIANSSYISRRIHKVWRRHADVIYPPVDVAGFQPGGVRGDAYVCACRLVPYKRVDLVIKAFAMNTDRQLVVIGDGPEMSTLKAIATENVTFLGWQPFHVLRSHLQQAKAFVFAGEEDFGILPVEAQACGTPVVAYGRGGLAETVRNIDQNEPTGILFFEQTPESINHALSIFEGSQRLFKKENLVSHAAQFSRERFRKEFREKIVSAWQDFKKLRLHQ